MRKTVANQIVLAVGVVFAVIMGVAVLIVAGMNGTLSLVAIVALIVGAMVVFPFAISAYVHWLREIAWNARRQ